MPFQPEPSYTYNDIGLVPRNPSRQVSRSDLDTQCEFLGMTLSLPIVLAPMQTVVGYEMVVAINNLSGVCVLPRTGESIPVDIWDNHIPSIGIRARPEWKEAPPAVCIDVANGFHTEVENAVRFLRKAYPDTKIITGNIASVEGYVFLMELGVDAVRVGIGGGSVCTTSIATGVGVGQASIVRDIAEWRQNRIDFDYGDDNSHYPTIIADGGIKTPGDVCVTGDTLILMKDLTWKKASEIIVGNELVGFDEKIKIKEGNTSGRRYYKTSVVQANTKQFLPCMEILTNKGKVTVSIDHIWLCKTTKGNALVWKKTKDLSCKDKIAYFGDPWEKDETREAGYLAGFFDSEGCLSISNSHRPVRVLSTSQALGQTNDLISDMLEKYSFSEYLNELSKVNEKHQDQTYYALRGLYNQLSFLGRIRPERLVLQAPKVWEDQALKFLQYAKVFATIDIGNKETYSVSTSTSTFIANGFMSHNCKAIALGADVVMAGGIFAGAKESPGAIIKIGDRKYKHLAGQASMFVKGQNEYVEGADKVVPYTGPVAKTWQAFEEGIRSGMAYMDCNTLEYLRFLPDGIFTYLSDAAKRERGVTA